MRQLIMANDETLAQLKARALGRCVQFQNEELPRGASPAAARIGFEVNPADNSATLFVDRCVKYDGKNPVVRQWIERGELRFRRFADFKGWLRRDLAAEFSLATGDSPMPRLEKGLRPVATNPAGIAGCLNEAGNAEPILPLVGRDHLLDDAEAALSQEIARSGVLVTGRSGVGKTAFVNELAARWRSREPGRVAFRAELPAILSGTCLPAERADRLHRVCDHVLRAGRSSLLILEDIHLACRGHALPVEMPRDDRSPLKPGADDFACLALRDAIDSGLRVCTTTTPRGLATIRDTALRHRLQMVVLDEPTHDELIREILPAFARWLETKHSMTIAPEATAIVVRRSQSRPGAQPAKAIRLLDFAVTRARLRQLRVLGPDDVFDAIPPAPDE